MTDNSIDAYLAGVADPDIRSLLVRLRQLIAAAAPDAEESWSYGMPAFLYRGKPLAGFSAATRHAGFYPMSGDLLARHAEELTGFSFSKGTLRLTPETGIPEALIRILVHERKGEIEGGRRG